KKNQKDGKTALDWVAAAGNLGTLRVLLEHGATPEGINEAFVAAAGAGERDSLRLLLDKGANVHQVGTRALMHASLVERLGVTEQQRNDTVSFLLAQGVDVNASDEEGWTALLYAATHRADFGAASTVQILLDKGADINAQCSCSGYLNGGWTA